MTKEERRQKFLLEHPNFTYKSKTVYIPHPRDKRVLTVTRSLEKWRQKNPEKVKAHRIVYVALRNGTIKRKPCKECGNIKSEAHHEDYNQPLKIKWLCKYHHVIADTKRRNRINRQ